MHQPIEPGILYFGTPVVLVSTVNECGTYNLAPMSSAFWLGWRCVLGLATHSKTTQNIRRTGTCVLNLPSVEQVTAVNHLALTTGTNPVPAGKRRKGYRFEPDKFGVASLTPISSDMVTAPRVLECPIQLEATVEAIHGLAEDNSVERGALVSIELRVLRIHAEESLLTQGRRDHIDPDKWRPIIMSFQNFYGLGPQLRESRLATIPESLYRRQALDGSQPELT